jgi:hypothetical protein
MPGAQEPLDLAKLSPTTLYLRLAIFFAGHFLLRLRSVYNWRQQCYQELGDTCLPRVADILVHHVERNRHGIDPHRLGDLDQRRKRPIRECLKVRRNSRILTPIRPL